MKHRVDSGIYVFYGSMNPQLSERTGFSDADAETVKQQNLELLAGSAGYQAQRREELRELEALVANAAR